MNSKILRGFGLACALALAGCATQEPETIQLSTGGGHADRQLAAQASAFESFMRKARAIDAGFSSPTQVQSALAAGASHDPKQLEAGMVAYAAMAALQEPKFAAAARAGGPDLARRIAVNPEAVFALPGSTAAAARASGALYAQGTGLAGEGRKVKQAAYSVQKQAWSKARVPNAPGRLANVKRISAAGYQPGRHDTAALFHALAESGRRPGAVSPVVARGVALAALSAQGQQSRGKALMSDARTSSCVRIAKLNLYQCLSAAGPHYEDIYCLGQHAMIEPAQCVTEAAAPPKRAVQKASYRR
ncbi:hypothetical protein [Phenylobacterium sp.]|jgi:hypothetical protein|uniref:hypothetical protein n=1 Tax=Phenylobacterium sp. TaxID=1871053 RepID=UPI002F95416F